MIHAMTAWGNRTCELTRRAQRPQRSPTVARHPGTRGIIEGRHSVQGLL